MDPVVFMFFFGVPLCFGLLQFFLIRSKAARGRKYIPLGVVGLAAALTWGAVFGYVPLPKTFFFDQSSFMALPDFMYVGLFCFPALFGIMVGAIFGVGSFPKK